MSFVIRGKLVMRRPRAKAPKPSKRPRTAPRRGDRSARMLALAHRIEQAIEDGALRDVAHAARLLGISRARLSQITALQNLAPDIQARILAGDDTIHERQLRAAVRLVDWSHQREALKKTKNGPHRTEG